jgi:hypothetical protein
VNRVHISEFTVAKKEYRSPESEWLRRNGEIGAGFMARDLQDRDDGYQDIQTDNADVALSDLAGQ